ncbi:hypothetical protein [Salmonirosea aquatica]|uniref:Uncharacterized protein n=1 Tax=Salmonirosea aquatica TaxID=2654236 RepID=A0A7C9BHJ0_9BACT|nr:hypothetical protein [Cytophagaceae bacterium SJW1-29]
MVTYRVFDEVIDFITSIPRPEDILAYKPSLAGQQRLELLVEKKRSGLLSDDEMHELEQYLMVEHLMRVAKKKAKSQVNG